MADPEVSTPLEAIPETTTQPNEPRSFIYSPSLPRSSRFVTRYTEEKSSGSSAQPTTSPPPAATPFVIPEPQDVIELDVSWPHFSAPMGTAMAANNTLC